MRLYFATALCVLSLGMPAISRAAPSTVLGFLNLRTGGFTPANHTTVGPAANAATGTIQVSMTISIQSALKAGDTITCSASADIFAASGNSFDEGASSPAAISGTTATCTVVIPYKWAGATTSDSFTVGYSLNDADGARISSGSVATYAVPANGKTTKAALSLVF